MTPELEVRGIVKRFSNVVANDHIDLVVEPGEIRAIVGENGAGKTTLMNILYGLYRPDEGEMFVRGKKAEFHSPSDSIRAGLGMVHQQFMLFPSLTVTENVIYGFEPSRRGLIDRKAAAKQIAELSRQYGLDVDPGRRVGSLPVGVRQKVEILKTLFRKASILILDEPTAVLTPQERDGLFEVLRGLRVQGKTVLFITHKLNEVMEISDSATVLRNGRVTANLVTKETSPREITEHMVGRDVLLEVDKTSMHTGREVLELRDVVARGEDGQTLVKEVSLTIRGGEILGVAGVSGNGQSELVEAIVGLRPVDGGQIRLDGQEVTATPLPVRRRLIGLIPEDRMGVGSAVQASVSDNLIMGYQAQMSKNSLLRRGAISEFANTLRDRFRIKAPDLDAPLEQLSGGNIQKAVVARELTHGHSLLVADQPTRGVDVSAIEFIYQQLLDYRSQGKAILLISADLGEIMSLSDRILVLYEGGVVGELPADEANEETLGLMMTGAWGSDGTGDTGRG